MPKLEVKVKNNSHQLPEADLGAGRGDHGYPFFFEILYYFYKILRKIKSVYLAGTYRGHPFPNFLNPPLHPFLHRHDLLLQAFENDLKQVFSRYIHYKLSVLWKDRVLIFECLILLLVNMN